MKKFRKIISIMLVTVMALAMSMTAFAQEKSAGNGPAKITINNAAKGETYTIYKLFDATATADGKIAYQSTAAIPQVLDDYFTRDNTGYVHPKDNIKDGNMTEGLALALENWAKTADATASEVSDGSVLEFTGLPYGYYVVTTTHVDETAAKALITVTSTNPNASIYDKNVNQPTADKTVEKNSYSIGDTVKYTGTFDTTNYMDNNGTSEQVVEYEISDTLPEYLSDVVVTKIMIGDEEYKVNDAVPQFNNKKIVIQWARKGEDGKYTSLYAQGSKIVITYEAKLASTTNINADDTNTISILPYVDKGGDNPPQPWEKPWEDTAVIRTYAAAIRKVDENGQPLAGATFTIKGLVVEAVNDENDQAQPGVYKVVSYNPASNDQSAELSTDADGKLYIVGLAEDVKLVVTEFKAPDGYNKLTETKELNAQKLSETIYESSGTKYYDEKGNLVKEEAQSTTSKTVEKNLSDLDTGALEITNNQGTLLPETGGIGTTIFYIVGAILMIGAGVILVAKKRMSHE